MQKFHVSRALFALALFGIVLALVACGGDTPTSTPVPPTVILPTALPPAPTAPPLTAAPTAVLPTQAPPPAVTAVVPPAATAVIPPTQAPTGAAASSAGAATATATRATAGGATTGATRTTAGSAPAANVDRGPLTGLYITNLRYEPGFPRNNDRMSFFATIMNRTGKVQNYPVCVEIYRPGAAKPFGTSSCDTAAIVPNTGEAFAGFWTGTGIKECIPVRARAVLREGESELRLPFTRLNGAELWIDFNVCP